jgi:hypothetical protein
MAGQRAILSFVKGVVVGWEALGFLYGGRYVVPQNFL